MNIDDIRHEAIKIPGKDLFVNLFEHQHALMLKYEAIERKAGAIAPHAPWHIDDPKVQMRLKDMFWRVTEELAEAIEEEVNLVRWADKWDTNADVRHVFEELADALHFLAEASIIANIPPGWVESIARDVYAPKFEYRVVMPLELNIMCLEVIRELGLAANCLKNKPWKQTHMETDVSRFNERLCNAWRRMLYIFWRLGMIAQEVYVLYCRKLEVNKFRQETMY